MRTIENVDFAFALAIIVVVAVAVIGIRRIPHVFGSLYRAALEFRHIMAEPRQTSGKDPGLKR